MRYRTEFEGFPRLLLQKAVRRGGKQKQKQFWLVKEKLSSNHHHAIFDLDKSKSQGIFPCGYRDAKFSPAPAGSGDLGVPVSNNSPESQPRTEEKEMYSMKL